MITVNIPLPAGGKYNNPKRIILHAIAQWIHIDESAARQLNVAARDYPALEWLALRGLSVHKIIDVNGNTIVCRHDTQQAFHAKGHNTDTLGLEFEVPGKHTYTSFIEIINSNWVSDTQFTAGVNEVRSWLYQWGLTPNDVFTHQQIDPDRKQDPGNGFPLNNFINIL